jgi:hypothetical protein
LAFATFALAQSTRLPPASRTVYKCMVAGKVVYTDDPCLAGQKVDVEPTRGANKITGSERTGADVQREKFREGMADAVRPITGMDAKQFDTASRRTRLAPDVQSECTRLDANIAAGEERERSAAPADLVGVQRSLLADRWRHRKLGC